MFTYGLVSDNDPLGISVSNGIEFNIPNNPRNNIQRLNASKPGERYLSFAEIKKIDLIFNESPLELDPDLKALLMLGIYTCGQRPFELAHSQKSLYDADNNKLTIAKEFTKLNRNNVIYICASAKRILEEQTKRYPDSDFYFPGRNYEKQQKVYNAKVKADPLKRALKPTMGFGLNQ